MDYVEGLLRSPLIVGDRMDNCEGASEQDRQVLEKHCPDVSARYRRRDPEVRPDVLHFPDGSYVGREVAALADRLAEPRGASRAVGNVRIALL